MYSVTLSSHSKSMIACETSLVMVHTVERPRPDISAIV